MIDMYNALSVNPEDATHEYLGRVADSKELRSHLIWLLDFVDFYKTENQVRKIACMHTNKPSNFTLLYKLAEELNQELGVCNGIRNT